MTTRIRAAMIAATLVSASLIGFTACKKAETPAPAPTAAPVAEAPTSAPSSLPVSVTDLSVGKALGPDKKVQTAVDTFSPKDTILRVGLHGRLGAVVRDCGEVDLDHHPALVHAGRHRRRHRLQQGRVHRDHRPRPRREPHARGAGRGVGDRLEGIRDGGGAGLQGQLHHRVLDREPRPDGRAHRGLDHGGAGADADRQGIPDHARRLDRVPARDRRGHRRLERAVRGEPEGRAPADHRDEPARVALLRAGVEGDRLPDRQGRGQARGGLHARRTEERDHRGRDAGVLRADHRLRRHQGAALRVREIPAGRRPADHADEIGGRGDGDRPHLPGVVPEGAARPGGGRGRPEPAHAGPRDDRNGAGRPRAPTASGTSATRSRTGSRWKKCTS